MRSSLPLVMLMALLLVVTPGAAPVGGDREDPARGNRRLLEKWRSDPDHAARLQRDLHAFWAMPPERRALLRKLDHDLHQEDSATQKRLWGVLERYHAWLERLPEEKRRLVELEADPRRRLDVVKRLREQEWVGQLPAPVRNRIEGMSDEKKRSAELARLREEQRQRQRDALRPPGPRPLPRGKPTRLSDFPPEVQAFVNDSLRPLLSLEKRKLLDDASGKPWPLYARTVAQFADEHPVALPGPVGPVWVADLPPPLKQRLRDVPRLGRAVREAQGKWPEFGTALLALSGGKRPALLPVHLMPASLRAMPRSIQEFVARELTAQEQAALTRAEGEWPAYPRALLEAARRRNLPVPGMTLPGPRELWDRARAALPELPERTLYGFWNELRREDPKWRRLSPADPNWRDEVKQEYFKRNPRERQRLQLLDVRPRPSAPRGGAD